METIKEKRWKMKFVEMPFLLRLVILWIYLISIAYFLKFLLVLLLQSSLDVFSLMFGFLIWELASGLINRSNLARVIALVWFGFIGVSLAYMFLRGGTVSFNGFYLTFLYPSSVIWFIVSGISVLVLLLPRVRKLFSKLIQE